jgi:hypothetical protein
MLNLRRTYRNGKLSDEQIQRLKELDFSFEPEEDLWQKRYRELAEYVSNGGDPNRIPNRNRLREWVRHVKISYKKGCQSQGKIELLEKLGVVWDDVGYLKDKWYKNIQSVEEYFESNGVNILPKAHPAYNWWKKQLQSFYKLPQDRIEKIRSLKSVKPRHRWSEHEKTLVRENSDKTAEELSELLIGRTPQAIQKLRDKYGWINKDGK